MNQAAHNMSPKRLSTHSKKQIALEALSNDNLSEVARTHEVTRKTARKQKTVALDSIDNAFSKKTNDSEKVLFYIPVTKTYIKMIITLLFVICKASIRDTKAFVEYAFDHQISVGHIAQTLDEATAKAGVVNQSYNLSSCKDSSTDELFHQGKPVLAAIDIDSRFCMGLSIENNRDHDTWGCFLLDLMERGYNPTNNRMDGGSGMLKAFEEVLEDVIIRYDHFHIIQQSKDDTRFLKNKRETAVTNAIKASTKMDKARKNNQQQKQAVNVSTANKAMIDTDKIYQEFKTLTEWLQYDVLQLESTNYNEREFLFDFIVTELKDLSDKHPHRIKDFTTTLVNQKEKLLSAASELNDKFGKIASQHQLTLETVWKVCNLTRFSIYGSNYHIQSLDLYSEFGDQYDEIEDDLLLAISTVHRTSSMIENLNSRTRPYLDPRKGFKKERFALIEFALNHVPFQRCANEEFKGKSAAEIFSKKENIDFLSLLGFQRFRKVA
jgi:hypothetical protein